MNSASDLAPIALFVFNRPDHTRATLQALADNDGADRSHLHVFADGPKREEDRAAIDAVRQVVRQKLPFRSVTIHESNKNKGLAGSIIGGVSAMLSKHDHVIVLEDDLITSPHFLNFMNDGLAIYAAHPEVASIHGYVYPLDFQPPDTFFIRGADCWGWATWPRAWKVFDPDPKRLYIELAQQGMGHAFDFDGGYPYQQMLLDNINANNDSWAIRWLASTYLRKMFTLYPGTSLVDNIGLDGTGTHSGISSVYRGMMMTERIKVAPIPIEENTACRASFRRYFRTLPRSHPQTTT